MKNSEDYQIDTHEKLVLEFNKNFNIGDLVTIKIGSRDSEKAKINSEAYLAIDGYANVWSYIDVKLGKNYSYSRTIYLRNIII